MRTFRTSGENVRQIAALIATHTGDELASMFGMHKRTVYEIARSQGATIRPRGQPGLGIPTCFTSIRAPWPFAKRGQRALDWARDDQEAAT